TYSVSPPDFEKVAAQYAEFHLALDSEQDAERWRQVMADWDKLRRELYEWKAVTEIRFTQDTKNEDYKSAKEHCDRLRPKLTDLNVALKRRLLDAPVRQFIEREFGGHVLDLWQCDIASFDPVIHDDLIRQSNLETEYTELLASASFDFQNEKLTLSQIGKFAEHTDRKVRRDAAGARTAWFVDNQEQLDRIYADLVDLRDGMARKLGYDNFVGLGYQWMHRVDYDENDVEVFRNQVRDHVVPLCVELKRRQATALEVDPLMFWDEALHDPRGNPAPQGDHDWMVDRAREMFRALGSGMDEFFAAMCDRNLMDLKSRDGKAGGGYCDGLPMLGMPFIFANFNGTKGDVEVFTHEMGHAFQNYSSRHLPFVDLIWPTSEGAEIHSMSLEFLTWPEMERFFGGGAARFRQIHLAGSISFLPYGVAVDHFQHLVYKEPDATPERRNEMWQDLERTYLPWQNFGDLQFESSGRRWQAKQHIYNSPFYYIDYTLALTCAMQLWLRAEEDLGEAMQTYVALCQRGGSAPFRELVQSAGLKTPFEVGCLTAVVEAARKWLDAAA
ncbi:MAG: M3 family oligoendopeptidase, partial [Pirellulales bacterium]